MLIQDVERQTNMDRATIRFYEKEGIIVPVRAENGYRSYSVDDIQLLLKIKLLRQLGVSLYKIKKLQQGSGDFSLILSEQITILDRQIQENTQAKFVCQQMQQEGAEFTTLDSNKYLEMLSAPAVPVNQAFCEPVKKEIHPWRRYFARMLDYRIVAAILQFLIVVIIRIRPIESSAIELLNFASYFLAVPTLAVLIHLFGTTPGKWAMGIQLENVNGGKLSGGEALYREGKIIWHGLGFFIPILISWRMYRSYKDDTEGSLQCWNEDTEIVYKEWSISRKLVAVVILVCTLLVSLYAAFDVNMPTYRAEKLTVSQFSKNHQDYENMWDLRNEYYLGEDGTWQLRNDVNHGYYVIGEPNETERPNFHYQLDENGKILVISYQNSWENSDFQDAIPHYCHTAISAVVGANPRCSYLDLIKVEELLESELYSKLSMQQGSGEGLFKVKNITVSWKTEIENCEQVYNGTMFAADELIMPYSLQLRIEIE